MKFQTVLKCGALAAMWLSLATGPGCARKSSDNLVDGPSGTFTLAWSEYPSWSVFGVADEAGLIDKDEGEMGELEKKWGVDVVLRQLDYDPCISAYSSSTIDAVCITNMDILSPSLGRNSVAILPTSTSDGADACIVTGGIDTLEDLKGKESLGLELSVSQYMFERVLEVRGQDPKAFPFKQMAPNEAAQAMQTKQEGVNSIVVWNPFVMQTLGALQGDAKVLFDSTEIPEEIVDMVVVAEDALNRPGGKAFAACIVEAFYEVNQMLASPSKGDDTLIALGKKFSGLSLDDMKVIVQQTKFYKTPEEGIGIFTKPEFRDTLMPRVIDFCASHGIIDGKPSVSFENEAAQLRFDTSFMEQVSTAQDSPTDEN